MTPFLGPKPLMLPDIYNSRGTRVPTALSFHTLMLTDPSNVGASQTLMSSPLSCWEQEKM